MFTTVPADVARVDAVNDLTDTIMDQIPPNATDVSVKIDWEVKEVDARNILVPNVSISYKLKE